MQCTHSVYPQSVQSKHACERIKCGMHHVCIHFHLAAIEAFSPKFFPGQIHPPWANMIVNGIGYVGQYMNRSDQFVCEFDGFLLISNFLLGTASSECDFMMLPKPVYLHLLRYITNHYNQNPSQKKIVFITYYWRLGIISSGSW